MPNSTYEIRVQRLNESPGSIHVVEPGRALDYWREKITACPWHDPEREACIAILVNPKCMATGHALVGIGTLNECVVHPLDVFRAAVAMNAYGVVVMHNHPSGDPSPSENDRLITKRLSEAGTLLCIRLMDHVIVGTSSHFSFKESGLL